jgi:DNA-binding XRE family transcriptional regulator
MTEKQVDRKYKYTKQLVRMAIEHGMTNKEIAKKAGLSDKSVAQVTRWRKGDSLATVRQMQFFINEFGDLLKRKIEHLFCFKDDGVIKHFKLSGDIILRHVYKEKVRIDRKDLNVGILRFVIIKHSEKFTLLSQYRMGLEERDRGHRLSGSDIGKLVQSSSEGANWVCYKADKFLNAKEIVEATDSYAKSFLDGSNYMSIKEHSNHSEIMFLVREQMMKNGFIAEDIFDLDAQDEIINEPKKA